MLNRHSFKKISDYCIQLENYTVAMCIVSGKKIFECWNMDVCEKRFTDPDQAKDYVIQQLEKRHDKI